MGVWPSSGGEADPGIALDDRFFRTVVENAHELIVAFDEEGTIVYVTPSSEHLLGLVPADGVGRNIVEFLHPDELERALIITTQALSDISTIGNGLVRLRHADGSWIPVDITLGAAIDGERKLIVAFCRFALARQSEAETLLRLLDGAPTHEVLAPLVNAISWQNIGSHMAICWTDDGTRHHVSTGLPDELCGGLDAAPWSEVRRTGIGVMSMDLHALDAQLEERAASLDRGGYWIEPVAVAGFDEPALVTVWTRATQIDPKIHELGMETARRYVGVVLDFTAQRRLLDHAASHDPLTGLVNRSVLVDALSGQPSGGALVYCDLDHFKPVNDAYGHAVGDKLLDLATQRLKACVRAEDLTARIGGDEFVILLRDADRDSTETMAKRIIAAFQSPFALAGHSIDVGVSIGLVCAPRLDVAALDDADRAMYQAKSAGRGVYRWSGEPD